MRGVRTLGLCIPLTRADGATSPHRLGFEIPQSGPGLIRVDKMLI